MKRLAYAASRSRPRERSIALDDPLIPKIETFLADQQWVLVKALTTTIGSTPTKQNCMRVAAVLRALGWQRHPWRGPAGHAWYWLPPGVHKQAHCAAIMDKELVQ
jgi:hypothetical protein